MDRKCKECGAKLNDSPICENCGMSIGIEAYGYKLELAPAGGYLLKDRDGNPLYPFQSLGSRTQTDIAKRTGADMRIVEREFAKLANILQPDEEEEGEENIVYRPFYELEDGRLAEQGFDGKSVYYLVFNPETQAVTKVSEIEIDDFTLRPIDNDDVRQNTVLLPEKTEEYGTDEQLLNDVKNYLNTWHEPPNLLSRVLDAFYTLLTYIFDLVPQLPYRRYLAPWGKGKSAWIEALGWICYRGIILAGSDTDKSVVRKINNWSGTALIDEADFGDSTFYAYIVKILNIGYNKKTGFYQRADDNDPIKTIGYNVYGPKLLATRRKYKDLALESRCLTTIGRQNTAPIPLFRMDQFLAQAQTLRNKLLLWRFRNYYNVKEKAKRLEDKDIADMVYDGAEGISSRVKQVILPLWLIAGDELKGMLTNLAKEVDTKLKIEDPDYLLEVQAKAAVTELIDGLVNGGGVNIGHVVNVLMQAPGSPTYEIQLSAITRMILEQRGTTEDKITINQVTSISKRLKNVFETNLGFTIRIGSKRRRMILIPHEWVSKVDKPTTLDDLLYTSGEAGDLHKDVHYDTYVHPPEGEIEEPEPSPLPDVPSLDPLSDKEPSQLSQTHTDNLSSLQEDIRQFKEGLAELNRELKGEAYEPSILRKKLGWLQGPKFGRVLTIAKRDRLVFEPHAGYLKGVFD